MDVLDFLLRYAGGGCAIKGKSMKSPEEALSIELTSNRAIG